MILENGKPLSWERKCFKPCVLVLSTEKLVLTSEAHAGSYVGLYSNSE